MWGDAEISGSGLAYRRLGIAAPDQAQHRRPTLLLLHGIPGSGAAWRRVTDHLPGEVEVVVPDLLGFGASRRPETPEALHAVGQALALAHLLDELDTAPVVVVGHDFGGPVALALLGLRPDQISGLGLLATNTFPDTPIPFPLSTLTWPLLGPAAAAALLSRPALALVLRSGVGRPRHRLAAADYLGDRAQQHAIRTIFHASLTRLSELYQPIQDQLERIDVATLVGWGERDPFFSIAHGERTAAAAGVPLRVYPGAGHFLPEERPADIAADIAALIATAVPR